MSLVEINLLRDGPWVLQVPIRRVPPDHREPYAACVHRGWTDDVYEFYAMPITGPLQKVRIPLRKGDADALLDLQALLDEAYAKSPSRRAIDYTVDAHPPLTGDAEVWADDLLRKAGRRPAVT